MENIPQSRRSFLAKVALLLASAGLLWRYLTPRTMPQRQVLLSVPRADIPSQGALVYREERVALVHVNGEYYALSLVCTHLGCTLNMSDEQFDCPCHGSRFDRRGSVLKGPAERPLRRFQTQAKGAMIEVLAG
jgi:cytochrome b6-f complex iron-sulfur subunit